MGLWSGLDYNPFWYPRTWKMNIICILFVYYPHIYCLLVAYCLKFLIKQAYYPHIIWILSADWEMCLPNAPPLLPLQPQYEIISQNPAVAQRYLENRESEDHKLFLLPSIGVVTQNQWARGLENQPPPHFLVSTK